MQQDQVWVGNDEPTAEKLNPVKTNDVDAGMNKPRGGFWTSPLRDGSSAWIEWMKREHWCPHPEPKAWKLTIEGDPEVYVIDDVSDLKAITKHPDQPRHGPRGVFNYQIDWESVFDEYDAVHLTAEGQHKTRFTGHDEPDLYGWDCETVLWNDWHFENVELMGEVEIPVREV